MVFCSTKVSNTLIFDMISLKQTRLQLTRSWIPLFKLSLHIPCDSCMSRILAGFTFLYSNTCTHHKDKYTAKCFSAGSELLMATLLILPHCRRDHELSGVSCWKQLHQGLAGVQGCSAFFFFCCHCTPLKNPYLWNYN